MPSGLTGTTFDQPVRRSEFWARAGAAALTLTCAGFVVFVLLGGVGFPVHHEALAVILAGLGLYLFRTLRREEEWKVFALDTAVIGLELAIAWFVYVVLAEEENAAELLATVVLAAAAPAVHEIFPSQSKWFWK